MTTSIGKIIKKMSEILRLPGNGITNFSGNNQNPSYKMKRVIIMMPFRTN